MGDLRLKVRNKIYSYTSGSGMIDTTCNSNAIVVFLGKTTSGFLRGQTESFLKDTLKAQLPEERITCVEVGPEHMQYLPNILCETVKNVRFNPAIKNQLYISFITIMDDDFHSNAYNIDVSVIEKMKQKTLGGFLVEVTYDFYGLFASVANYEHRKNAKQTIINFLKAENGGIYIKKRIFHQACAGNDYYRAAKSLAFMILGNLIGKIENHRLIDCRTDGVKYDWNTFVLYEKNLVALVVYEMINQLLKNQLDDYESVPQSDIEYIIDSELDKMEKSLRGIVSMEDYNYMPIVLSRREVAQDGFLNKMRKVKSVEFREERINDSINMLIEQQREVAWNHVREVVTVEYLRSFMDKLVRCCSSVGSVHNKDGALIITSLRRSKTELENKISALQHTNAYNERYLMMICQLKLAVIDKVIEFYEENVEVIRNRLRYYWNQLHSEVNALINSFVQFQEHFEGLSTLVENKHIKLMSTADDVMDAIDIQSVVRTINQDKSMYARVLKSYFDTVKSAGDIAIRYGNCNISPELNNIAYTLFTATEVECPDSLQPVVDKYWFMEHEIAILLTVKNKPGDCENLPING